jgi:hypothetical protein
MLARLVKRSLSALSGEEKMAIGLTAPFRAGAPAAPRTPPPDGAVRLNGLQYNADPTSLRVQIDKSSGTISIRDPDPHGPPGKANPSTLNVTLAGRNFQVTNFVTNDATPHEALSEIKNQLPFGTSVDITKLTNDAVSFKLKYTTPTRREVQEGLDKAGADFDDAARIIEKAGKNRPWAPSAGTHRNDRENPQVTQALRRLEEATRRYARFKDALPLAK